MLGYPLALKAKGFSKLDNLDKLVIYFFGHILDSSPILGMAFRTFTQNLHEPSKVERLMVMNLTNWMHSGTLQSNQLESSNKYIFSIFLYFFSILNLPLTLVFLDLWLQCNAFCILHSLNNIIHKFYMILILSGLI